MRIAVPLNGNQLAPHFGHCERFALLDIDLFSRSILSTTLVDAPEHQPGLLPSWLKERAVDLVIAGNMGTKARARFAGEAITVIAGAKPAAAEAIVQAYLEGRLETGENTCRH